MDIRKLMARIAIVQFRLKPGDVTYNLRRILEYIEDARTQEFAGIVFPELAVPGYMLGDHWEIDAFIREIEAANEAICAASKNMFVVWGSVRADWNRIGEDGRVRKYNAALVAQNGSWVSNGVLEGWIPKTNLPKYRIFDDARHFYPAGKLAEEMGLTLQELLRTFTVTVDGQEVKLAIANCEDFWEEEYNDKPSEAYKPQHPHLVINISQSPWTAGKTGARDRMLIARVHDAEAPILYVNVVGLQDTLKNLIWFDGGSTFVDRDGVIRWRAPYHKDGLFSVELSDPSVPCAVQPQVGIAEIHSAIIHAMQAFYGKFPKVIVGLSGGVDSALKLALLVEAIGAENIVAVNMPGPYSSQRLQEYAAKMAHRLRVEYYTLSITELYELRLKLMAEAGLPVPAMLPKENIQARDRGSFLAAVAAIFGGVFTCNGNKTEMALNYFTLYGDGAGAAAFLADLWKGQVYELARYINKQANWDVIPHEILEVIPSAELSPEQNVDEGKGDPIYYPYHDNLLRMFIEHRWSPEDVLERLQRGTLECDIGCAPGTINLFFKGYLEDPSGLIENLEWCWRQYCIEYKRHQLPPAFLASRRAFGFDRRAALTDAHFSARYYELRAQLIS